MQATLLKCRVLHLGENVNLQNSTLTRLFQSKCKKRFSPLFHLTLHYQLLQVLRFAYHWDIFGIEQETLKKHLTQARELSN